MTEMASHGPLMGVAVAAPFAAALLILLGPRRLTELWGYVAAIIAVAASALLLPVVLAGDTARLALLTLTPGLELAFRIDALGLTFALLASGLWVVTGVYSGGYVRADNVRNRTRYFAAFASSVGAALGVAFAGNLLTFFLFYELLTLSTYPLVVHKETDKAFAAGRRYLLFALGGGLALLTAIAWTWQMTGTLDFVPGGFLAGHVTGTALVVLFALFITGVSVKAAVMPLHSWLPAAMVAPTPVSALLHAVAVVKAGVFATMRVIGFVFGPEALAQFNGAQILAGLAGATIVIGSLIALRQDNLKRRLAYSTVVHLSYIVLGAALVTPFGYTGSVMHMVNHGLAKITLFFCAGAIYVTTHKENISEMAGLGRAMPWTFGAFTVGSLALIGLPGLSGFVGKFFLARGAIQADDMVSLAIMLGASLLTASYLLPIVRIAFFPGMTPEGEEPTIQRAEAPAAMVVPLMVTTVLVVIFGVLPAAIAIQYQLAASVAARVFGGVP
ncbi:monovalent cation/H+ antiporter subunit D family protein [soil metagenome]